MSRYLKSDCKARGYLHDFKIIEAFNQGLIERCTRCGLKMFFPHDTPNFKYLEFHVRQALQVDDPKFLHEYPNAIKK